MMVRRMFIGSVLAVVVVVVLAVCPARAELLIHYEFDEGSGSSAYDASSGTAHDGLFTSPPDWSTTDKAPISGNNSSVMLDDNANRVTTGDADDLDSLVSFTAMMWVKDEPTGDNQFPRMIDKSCPGIWWKLQSAGGSLDYVRLDMWPNGGVNASWSGLLSTDGWHHWAVVFDGTEGESDEALATFYFDANPFHSGYIGVSDTGNQF